MDVTVLIRCYEQEQYLFDCTRRLGTNSYVILDDYPKLGKCERLNRAIPEVTTKWVAFNDADDMSLPARFGWMMDVAKLKNIDTSKVDLFYTDCYMLSKKGVSYYTAGKFDRERLKRDNYIPFSTIIVRTEVAKKFKFIDVENKGEDWIWLNRIAKDHKIQYIDDLATMIYRNYSHPYGRVPILRKLKRIIWQRKVREVINEIISD